MSNRRSAKAFALHRWARSAEAFVLRGCARSARAFALLALVLGLMAPVASAQPPTAIPQTKFASGQNVVPYFEGWIRNRDGSFDMVFGYFNRNWQEDVAVPVGPDNSVEPGGPDRGQPTFFVPRRQGWVYRVRVPADFGKQTITWTIKVNGKIEKAFGELLPVEEITERIVMTRGNLNPGDGDPNKPPVVSIAAPAGVTPGHNTSIVATVADDGLPKPRPVVQKTSVSDATRIQAQANSSGTPRPRGLTVTWMQLRGPGKVAFGQSGPMPVADGRVAIDATFPAAGEYALRATANDGALSTKSDVTVIVGTGGPTAGPAADKPLIDNDRVTVREVSTASSSPPSWRASGDSVWVAVSPHPRAVFVPKGGSFVSNDGAPERLVAIDLKDTRRPPLENKSGYPLAFPRPGVKKLIENDRVIVWDYTWTPGQPTPMHFHDKEVVVVYVETGALKSTTVDGQSTANEFKAGDARFNLPNRTHTELLTTERARAIITELK